MAVPWPCRASLGWRRSGGREGPARLWLDRAPARHLSPQLTTLSPDM